VDGTAKRVCPEAGRQRTAPGRDQRHAFGWFRRIFPASFFLILKADLAIRENSRIFTFPVTVWLMIVQRLGGGTLAAAVAELVAGNGWDVLEPCKRVREGSISVNTGGYSQARLRIPVEAARRVAQRTFERLHAVRAADSLRERLFLLDGSSIRLAHTAALQKVYGLARNQHGDSHWPIMRVVVMHHVVTGLALAPEYGPMYGPAAVGEQELAGKLLGALPAASVVIGDRNFGVFSVMWQVRRAGHDVLVRLMRDRAAQLKRELAVGLDQPVTWQASVSDRRAHKELPPEASIEGRLVVVQREGSDEPLYLFTTLQEPTAELASLYKERWNIETDLRSLKEQVKLHSITAKTPEMVASELLLAIAAYNLIRAVMQEAAREAGVEPRRLSYSRSQSCFWAFIRAVSVDCSPARFEHQWKLLLRMLGQCKLPNRSRPSAPRAVWLKRSAFPTRKPHSPEKTK
jgi:hypothetical protein